MKRSFSKGIVFSIILVIVFSTVTVQHSNALTTPTINENMLLTKYSKDVAYFRTETVVDSFNQSHFFMQIYFYNGTFAIFHVFENIIYELERDYYSFELFEVKELNGSVSLFYAYRGQIYGTVIKVYNWNNGISSITTLYTSHDEYYNIGVFQDEDSYHLLLPNSISYYDTRINHIRHFFNGTEITKIHNLPYSLYDLSELLLVENQVFAFYQSYNYNETDESITLYLVGITDSGHFNSTVYELDVRWFSAQITVSTDKKFYLVMMTENVISATKFGINETIDDNSFRHINLDDYFWGTFEIFSYENYTYIAYIESDFFYLEYPNGRNYDNTAKTFTVIMDDNQTLQQDKIVIDDYSTDYPYVSFSCFIMANGSYAGHYFSKIESKEIEEYRFIDKYIYSLKVYTDLDVYVPETPLLFALKGYSSFAYFWIKYWSAIIVPIAFLGIAYAIFRKRINRSVRKMVTFLTRPIVPNMEKWKLVLINLWLFIRNSSNLIFTLWKANKKRLLISLLGLTILASIIVTSTTLFDSKRNTLIMQYVESANVNHDNNLSLMYNFNLVETSDAAQNFINENYTEMAMSAIMNRITTSTSLFASIISGYNYAYESYLISYNFSSGYEDYLPITYLGAQENYSSVINQLLVEGRLPNQTNEVLVSSYASVYYNIKVDDVLVVNSTSYAGFVDFSKMNLTVVGVYFEPAHSLLETICDAYNLPSDPISSISYSFLPTLVTFTPYYLENFENVSTYSFDLMGKVQFQYDFSSLNPKDLGVLIEEINQIRDDGPFRFVFDQDGSWEVLGELVYTFAGIGFEMQTTQFLIIFLSIPILYLALFLTLEVNEIFSTSFEQEIRILSSKGVSTGMITFIYSSMKFFESLVATFLGFGVNMLLLPALLKINKFITFESPLYSLNLVSLPAAMSATFLLLVIISVPRIIIISKTKKKVEKPPKQFIQLMKNIKLHYFLTIGFGVGLTVLSYWLLSIYAFDIASSGSALLVIFIYLMGIGVMIALLGTGLLIREIHKILMIALSKTAWVIRKNLFSLSLVEIRSDIKLFNNTFLTYIILVSIVIPFAVSPMLIQDKTMTEAYFYGGSDIYITNWDDYNASLAIELLGYSEIVSITNVSQIKGNYHWNNFEFFLLNDTEDYLSTAYKPKKNLFENWDSTIIQLNDTRRMLVSEPFYTNIADGEDIYYFVREGPVNDTLIQYNIVSSFNYFPIVYDEGTDEQNDPFFSLGIYSLVMTLESFLLIADLIEITERTFERLLINIKDGVNQEEFATKLKTDLGIEVQTTNEIADERLFNLIPFYSVLVAEFVFGILICIAAVVFTSLSNPLKMLQRRIVKHDIMKKIGLPTNRIIFLSAIELFIACILPGLAIGAAGGYGLLRLFSWIFISPPYSGGLPFKTIIPYHVGLVIFLGVPLLFYSIFIVSMKRNFAKYRPKNLE
ncbi:MAG: hypothetical protein KAU62_07865 [Candidatus Heimdallarchaeota archaeon]|nr:hypothetical protein [Candidatus Heimdallarchaeota archaeon]MCK4611056.1 hypothetical protein [Candidatus Heimdallarchaeota archaeon]